MLAAATAVAVSIWSASILLDSASEALLISTSAACAGAAGATAPVPPLDVDNEHVLDDDMASEISQRVSPWGLIPVNL